MSTPTPEFLAALEDFKRATSKLSARWMAGEAADDVFGDTYPKCLPSFDEFTSDVLEMDPHRNPRPDLPDLPAVGTIVRARYDLDCGGHALWPAGWTGEIMLNLPDDEVVSVQAHRYFPSLSEWDNCRVISMDDGICAYTNEFDRDPAKDDQPQTRVLAFALLQEFEVVS